MRELPDKFNGYLICMISSRIDHQILQLDELVSQEDADFMQSGLKMTSVIRVSRLAVVDGKILVGMLGKINTERLNKIKQKLSKWIVGL